MENNVNTNEDAVVSEIKKDDTIDIASLLKETKEEPIKPKSNLEKMKEAKANGGLGQVIDNAELHAAREEENKKIVSSKAEADAQDEVSAYLEEQDKLIETAKSVQFTEKPKTPVEMAAAMSALDDIRLSKQNAETPTDSNMIVDVKGGTAETKTEEEAKATSTVSEEKKEIVNVLIDKTGLGGTFAFTDEEKEKILSSTEIRVKQVEEIDLSTIKVKKANKSFMESVNEFQMSSSKVPVVFPASRFRAEMTGLSYGEMGDISLNSENITFDQVHKKLSVIYNKMMNPSIGRFENFEDFLHKFAYVDIDLAVYGLVVATFPDVDEIELSCNNKDCKKSFSHKFSPRTLIRFEKADNKFLETMKNIVECPASEFNKLVEESPVKTYQRIRLPYSNFIIEIGIASSYEYLYTIVDNMIGDKFTENHPDDVNGILQLNSALLGLIRSVYVPDGDEYVQYDQFEDMINALYMIKPEEIAILSTLLQKYTDSYNTTFELFDIVCPHCGQKTKSIPIDVNYLVFLKYQRLMSTELDINNVSVL